MKNEETSRETPRDNAEGKKACHPAIGGFASSGSNSAIRIPHSAFLSGFSLVELMIAVAMFGMTMCGAIGVYVMCQKLWQATSLGMATSRDGNMALSRLVYGVGSNNGLRTAASVVCEDMKGNWTGTDHVYPPAPGDKDHFLNNGSPKDSLRITCSNVFDGVRCIDFNKVASNIVFWPAGQPPPSGPGSVPDRETRQLICNYVSAAVVSTNASGVSIQLTILRQKGRYTSTNQISTFVKRRN
ncbi:MAG: prepilin-type N-terminal cleavage/methylation domain-containing protein [Verrucomicrobiota bacterium]